MKGIYIIKCTINGKVYVGQTTNFKHRVNAHKCSLRHGVGIQKLQSDWDKFGETNFEFIFVEEVDLNSEMNEREKFYISKYDAIDNGYNTNKGGIGQGNFGYLNGMYGKHHSEASKKLMSENRKGLTAGKNNPNYGNHDNSKFTPEVRAKMSAIQKERWKKYKENSGMEKV